MSIFYRILFVILAVCIPVVSLLAAYNIVLRLPDLYVYEFNSNEIANQIDLGIQDDELGQFFSDFMKGKEDEFDLFTEYRDREQSVFGAGEQIDMENARKLLNYTLYIFGGATLITILNYWIFITKKKKPELRAAFKMGIIIFAVLEVISFVAFYLKGVREFLYQLIFINPFGADDALSLMLTERFARDSIVASSIVAAVILVILGSITWRLTKPRRMFW